MNPDPATHKCPLEKIDYSLVEHGTIRCAAERGGCGRIWTFLDDGWHPSPVPVGAWPPAFRRAGRRTAATVPTSGDGPW